MSKRDPIFILNDMLDAIDKIFLYTSNMSYEDYLKDSKTIDAVIRNFEIIGEAANRIPEEVKMKFSEINWQRLRGFRNRIVLDYIGIDHSIVWTIIVRDLQLLRNQIKEISNSL